MSDGAELERFVVAATSGGCARTRAMLAARPELAQDRWAQLVLGRGWEGDPNEVGGPREWAPLHYVRHSCFASVELARELLARGAPERVLRQRARADVGAVRSGWCPSRP